MCKLNPESKKFVNYEDTGEVFAAVENLEKVIKDAFAGAKVSEVFTENGEKKNEYVDLPPRVEDAHRKLFGPS